MPPIVATFLTIGFILFLFRRDIKEKPNVTRELWIPFCWLIIVCSREVSEWCALFGIPGMGGSLEEGNPINRLFYLTLIVLGFRVLLRRQVSLQAVGSMNVWMTVFLAWCLLSVLWADDSFISLKRWIKVIGQPIMVLIILTEPDPEEALVRVLKRCAYILIPVSILFIKYYPEWGRGFGEWSGLPYNSGISSGKNGLGINCLILGIVLAWHLLRTWRLPKGKDRTRELLFCGLLIWMNGWLTYMSDSKTPFAALCAGLAILVFTGFDWVKKDRMTLYIIGAVVLYCLAESFFGIYEVILKLLGRDATLTERTDLWPVLLAVEINPLLGTGFESFWLGKRLDNLWRTLGWNANEAHNGYLETYLNLGIIGLFLLLGLLLATYGKACWSLLSNPDWGRLRLGFLIAMVLYNWTESGFKTTHPIFFMFYIIALDVPRRASPVQEPSENEPEDSFAPRPSFQWR
jgi:exopolysaccharide production protein ExoQ